MPGISYIQKAIPVQPSHINALDKDLVAAELKEEKLKVNATKRSFTTSVTALLTKVMEKYYEVSGKLSESKEEEYNRVKKDKVPEATTMLKNSHVEQSKWAKGLSVGSAAIGIATFGGKLIPLDCCKNFEHFGELGSSVLNFGSQYVSSSHAPFYSGQQAEIQMRQQTLIEKRGELAQNKSSPNQKADQLRQQVSQIADAERQTNTM
jgi:hypothetical protein